MNADFYWWLGVLHSDGYVYLKNNEIREIRLRVSKSSLPMLLKWKKVLDKLVSKEHKLLEEKMYDSRSNRHYVQYLVREGSKTSIKKLTFIFESYLIDKKVPSAILSNSTLSGAYLAGIIDGDGCIQIRKSFKDNRNEKLLKLTLQEIELIEGIRQLVSKVGLSRGYVTKYDNYFDLWIYLNKKWLFWSKKHLLKALTIRRKIHAFTI
ncbi:hypothetical protein HUU53_03150 [Candidatus Micrarchaeota archaeon]|nr:hypothetical protein [Candidatus Micrarchaeota archaeon]